MGKALEHVHEGEDYYTMEKAMGLIAHSLIKELEQEGRAISESVENNLPSIQDEVMATIGQYINRLMPLFNQCELIGTELPCRLSLDGVDFASHMDLLVRDTKNVFGYGQGRLLCIDWKYRKETPTKSYLSRNLQFFLYWEMIRSGSVLAAPWLNKWVEYRETPQMIWCHLPNLKPYARKTTAKDENGHEKLYVKGDERPISSVMRGVNFITDDETVSTMKNEMIQRVTMMRLGMFPQNPDPVGCQVCEAQDFCTRGDTAILMERQ